MNPDQFQPSMPGQLVPVTGVQDVTHAFLPELLPPKWEWPAALWPQLLEAHRMLATLDGTGRHLASADLLMRPLQRREALRSSSLEGTSTEPEEQALFDLAPLESREAADPVNAFREVHNYARALRLWTPERPISLHLIRELHATLLDGVRGSDQNPGQFRTRQNQIGKPPRFVPPPPHLLQDLLQNLEAYSATRPTLDPLVAAFVMHYQFEAIHPFMDGNGRVGRLLLAVLIHHWCNLSGQWLYLSAYFDANKDAYMDRLLRVSTHGDWTGWISFCLDGVITQSRDALERSERLLSLRKDFHERLRRNGRTKLAALVDNLFVSPAVRVGDAESTLSVSYPTAKRYLDALVSMEILLPRRDSFPMSYICKPILDATFGD